MLEEHPLVIKPICDWNNIFIISCWISQARQTHPYEYIWWLNHPSFFIHLVLTEYQPIISSIHGFLYYLTRNKVLSIQKRTNNIDEPISICCQLVFAKKSLNKTRKARVWCMRHCGNSGKGQMQLYKHSIFCGLFFWRVFYSGTSEYKKLVTNNLLPDFALKYRNGPSPWRNETFAQSQPLFPPSRKFSAKKYFPPFYIPFCKSIKT